jgi:hypothetical protein
VAAVTVGLAMLAASAGAEGRGTFGGGARLDERFRIDQWS